MLNKKIFPPPIFFFTENTLFEDTTKHDSD